MLWINRVNEIVVTIVAEPDTSYVLIIKNQLVGTNN